MSTAALRVWNLALEASHAPGRVSSENEISREREICSLWYDLVRTTVLQANYWPSSRKLTYLPLIKTRDDTADWVEDDPEPGYKYKYGLPTDYVRAWHLLDYSRFSISTQDSRTFIHSNMEKAVLVYSVDQTDISQWDPLQMSAIVYGLAARISGPLTGKNSVIQKNLRLANDALETAAASAADITQNDDVKHVPPELAARGFGDAVPNNRYYYPLGSHFAGISS